MVCGPAVVSVTENEPWPFVSLESGGSCVPLAVSLLLKCAVPPYCAMGFPRESAAVTSMVNGWPAIAVVGTVMNSVSSGAPLRNALKRFAVICWIRASARWYQ